MFNKLFTLLEPAMRLFKIPENYRDKFAHFTYLFAGNAFLFAALYFVSYAGLKWSLIISFVLVNLVGVAKEHFDSLRPLNKFDWKDILANLAGSGLFCLIIFLTM